MDKSIYTQRFEEFRKLYIVILINIISAMPVSACAGVFEELENGTLNIMHDGPADSATSNLITDLIVTSSGMDKEVAPAILQPGTVGGAVILDAPDKIVVPTAGSLLPRPKVIGKLLSVEQRAMRRMATEVALTFSRQPSVTRARLDQAAFVKLFTTMIHRESNFNPHAVSPVGAKGLGQLMPLTARDLGVCDVFSPRENLEGAATYLTAMLDQFGSAPIALAAYNAGPTAVTRHRGIPPYRETRQYVADIMAATHGPSDTPSDAIFDLLAHMPAKTAGPIGLMRLERGAENPAKRSRCRSHSTDLTIAQE